ncbi:MAG: ATP-dependent metallopeptidase FtsH/Yme1/Tma family protein, partial [Ktedonobacteraceae bacterium]
MDGKGGRRLKASERRRKDMKSYEQNVSKFLKAYKRSLLTCILLIAMMGLLFGIVSRFQAPSINAPPNGVAVISYSTFVGQVNNGNVIAVTFQGNGINVLLASPYTQKPVTAITPIANSTSKNAADFAAWSRYVGAGYPTWPNTSSPPPFDPARAAYTQMPPSGDAGLMQLLLSKHILVSTLPVAQAPVWLSLLWRFAPIVFFMLVLFLILVPRNPMRASGRMDDRVSQLGKSRARRFERSKEAAQPRSDKPTPAVKPTTPVANGQPRVNLEPPVTFADVAGIDEVRAELEE